MSGPNFVTDADAFDVAIIAGMTSPGICKVEHAKKHEWDRKKGKGATGGTAQYTGSHLQEFSIEFYLWLPAHFDAWPKFATALAKSTPVAAAATAAPAQTGNIRVATPAKTTVASTVVTPQPSALDIYHPSLAEPPYNVTRCIVMEVGGKKPDGKGGASYTYKFSEYSPTKPSGGAASGSKDGTGGGAPEKPVEPTAQTQGEKELKDLLDKVNNP